MATPRPRGVLRVPSGRGALLVPDVEGDGQEQDGTLDDLLGGRGGTHELHAVGHDGHDEATDKGAGQASDTAGRRRTTDEAGGDGVELEHVTRRGLRACHTLRGAPMSGWVNVNIHPHAKASTNATRASNERTLPSNRAQRGEWDARMCPPFRRRARG